MKKLLASPVLPVVAGLLAGVGTAVFATYRAAGPILAKIAEERAKKEADKPAKEKGWDFWTIEIENLANELREERARLKHQAEQIDQRTARLANEQQQLAGLRAEVEAMRAEVGRRVIEITGDESKNIRTLAQTYTNLTPRGAVALIREMDDTTVVKILSQMKPDIVAPIFEEMSRTATADGTLAKRAALLSEKIRLLRATKLANTP